MAQLGHAELYSRAVPQLNGLCRARLQTPESQFRICTAWNPGPRTNHLEPRATVKDSSIEQMRVSAWPGRWLRQKQLWSEALCRQAAQRLRRLACHQRHSTPGGCPVPHPRWCHWEGPDGSGGGKPAAAPTPPIREDCSINRAAVEELEHQFSRSGSGVCVESGGRQSGGQLSPELVDLCIYVIDVARGRQKARARASWHYPLRPVVDQPKSILPPWWAPTWRLMQRDTGAHLRGGPTLVLHQLRSARGALSRSRPFCWRQLPKIHP